jgi:integrase
MLGVHIKVCGNVCEVELFVVPMLKRLAGSTFKRKDGSWWARVIFQTEDMPSAKDLQRRAQNRTHAIEIRDRLVREIEQTNGRSLGERRTFSQLADQYIETYAVAPRYLGDRKVSGMRDWRNVRRQVERLRSHFGKAPVRNVTYGSVRAFRQELLTEPTKNGHQRSIATANRILSLLRRMLNVAKREGWITKNPFHDGETLISVADENHRTRILTIEEERRLLAECVGRRSHLRAVLVAALDTGMRLGEIKTLVWSDVDFENGILVVRALNSKTLRARQVPMTLRLRRELDKLAKKCPTSDSVFGIRDNVRSSFETATKRAGVAGLRFHDLRHTAATRLAERLQIVEVGRVLGHRSPVTTYRYVNTSTDTLRRAAEILNQYDDAATA